MKDNYAYSEPWHIQNSLFNPFQGFLCIFKDVDAYSVTLTGAEGRPQSTLILERKVLIVSIFG